MAKLPTRKKAEESKEEAVVDIEECVPDWRKQVDLIKEMRGREIAPVDVLGCDRLADSHSSPANWRFQTLLSLMLSSQTKDQITAAAVSRLQSHFAPDQLSASSLLTLNETELAELIYPVGFYRVKAKSLLATSLILKEKYKGDIPGTIEELTSLPGIGAKMGYLALQCAWGINAGIGVDVHVHRISQRLGWTDPSSCKTPEDTRLALQELLPKDLWRDINPLLVGFGQTICLPRGPKCSECSVNKSCPSAFKFSPVKSKRK